MLFNVHVIMDPNYRLILFCFFANILYSDGDLVRTGNHIEGSIANDTKGIPEGYLEYLRNLIQEYKAGKIQYEALNTFNKGLQEYHFYSILEKKNFQHPKILSSNPIRLLNYYNDSITINNVSAYAFPGLKQHGDQPNIETASSSSQQMEVTLSFKSNVTILTGNFEIFNSTYFFVYTLKDSVSTEYSRKGCVKFSLSFSTEELLHTYDSSYPRYTEANEIFVQHFNEALLKYFLPTLFLRSDQSNMNPYIKIHAEYARTYRKLILSAISESVILYSTAKGLNSFEVVPVNFTKSVDSQVVEQQYKDIKMDGILDFVNNELINSTTQFFDSKLFMVKLHNTIQLTYADKGDKQAFVSFVINDGGRTNNKKFRVKNIQITCVFDSTIRGASPLDYITFLIEFQLQDFDPIYESLVRHIGSEIARAFMQTLKEPKELS